MSEKLGSVQDMLKSLPPEQQAIAQDYAKVRVEAKMLKTALSQSQQQFAHLYAFLIAVLRQMPDKEIRFARKDFEAYQMFKENWEMRSEYDEGMDEQVLKLEYRGGGGDGSNRSGGRSGRADIQSQQSVEED